MKSRPIHDKIKIVSAHIIKNFRNAWRFRTAGLNTIFNPFFSMFTFLITYSAVFVSSNVDDLGFVQKSNYVLYVLTGFVVYSSFRLTWGRTSLIGEKMMLTLEGNLLAPGNRLYFMIGKSFEAFLEIFFVLILSAFAIFFLKPQINLINLALGILAILCVIIIFISLDFIVSAIGIAQEGISYLLSTYIPKIIMLISCIYYPIEVIPRIFQPIVYINPIYYAVNFFRAGFMPAHFPLGTVGPIIYLIVLALITPILSIKIFEWVLRRWGIRGY